MPLFISSSDPRVLLEHGFDSTAWQRTPQSGGVCVLFLALVIFATGVLAVEAGWRLAGIRQTSVSDDMRLWSIQRDMIGDGKNSSNTVALLGGSRMQLGFSSDVFREMFPDRRFVRLDVAGKKPVATLKDIAENTAFNGVAIVDVYTMALTLQSLKDQQPHVDYYHDNWTLDAFLNRQIKTFLEERLVSMNARNRIKALVRYLAGRGPRPVEHYLTVTAGRSFYADYGKSDQKRLAQVKEARVKKLERAKQASISPQMWLEQARLVEGYVRQIVGRGGRVVFVRFPVDLEDWLKTYERILPKEKYWDVYARESLATMIHFADYPQLQFSSPDGSHLDMRDAKAFTRNFLEILEKQGVFMKR